MAHLKRLLEELDEYHLPSVFQASIYVAYEYWARVLTIGGDDRHQKPAGYFDRTDGNWLEPCDIYLYQTSVPGVKKFGISKDHLMRARTSDPLEKDRYIEYLSHVRVGERRDALLIEEYLKTVLSKPELNDENALLSGSVELTNASEAEFLRAVKDAFDLIDEKGVEGLIEVSRPKGELLDGDWLHSQANQINKFTSGEEIVTWRYWNDPKKADITQTECGGSVCKFQLKGTSIGALRMKKRLHPFVSWDVLEKQILGDRRFVESSMIDPVILTNPRVDPA